jgi:hypothetical protein
VGGTHGVTKDIMWASPTDKVLAYFRVPPIDIDRLNTHSFGTHHLLARGLKAKSVWMLRGSFFERGAKVDVLLAAFAAFLPFDPWLVIEVWCDDELGLTVLYDEPG